MGEDGSGETVEARKDDARAKEGAASTEQIQKQEPTLLVTDSWRLANKCMVVAELSMPPSQESSSDSVFTDPEELAAIAAKEQEAAKTPSITAKDQHRVGPSSVSPLFGKPVSFSSPLFERGNRYTRIGNECFEVTVIREMTSVLFD